MSLLTVPAVIATIAGCSSQGVKSPELPTTNSVVVATPATTTAATTSSGDPLYDRWAAALTAAGVPFRPGLGSSQTFDSDKSVCESLRKGTLDAWDLAYTYGISPSAKNRNPEESRRAQIAIPILCPDQQPLLDEAKTPNPKMTIFRGGKAFVGNSPADGSTVQPGTYKTGKVSDCYWERLDSQGNIIENNMVSLSQSVVVTILPTDGAFVSKRCGDWTRVD